MLSKLKTDPRAEYPGYELKNNLGKGAYGQVRSAKHQASGRIVAIKKMDKLFENKFYALRALREVTLLRVVDHPNIIKIYEIIPPQNEQDFNTLSVVLEYLPVDLRRFCTQNVALLDENIDKVIYQILLALKYLKDAKILHRDLKPENLLVDTKTFELKLCDFGLARSVTAMEDHKNVQKEVLEKLNEEEEIQTAEEIKQLEEIKKEEKKLPLNKLTFHVVTRFYRAPELILLNPYYDSSIEMWSVGCILAELVGFHTQNRVSKTDYKPFFQGKACFPLSPPKKEIIDTYSNHNGFPHSEDDQISVILNIIGTPSEEDVSFLTDKYALQYIKSFSKKPRKTMKTLFNYCRPEWADFLERTLVFNPKKRISIEEALAHPMFAKQRNEKLQNFCPKVITENLNLHSGLTIEQIKEKFIEEIRYHQNRKQLF